MLAQISDRNTRKRSEICSKLKMKTSKRPHLRRSGFSIVFSSLSIVDFDQVNICRVKAKI